MSDSIETFLEAGKLKRSLITVKLVKEINPDSYIIADKTKVAILDTHDVPGHAKNLIEGGWYKLIKCQKGDGNTVKLNKLFKPVKAAVIEDIDYQDIATEVETLEKTIKAKASAKKYQDFKTIATKENHSKIDKVTIKVITKSRVISTNRGNYQICNIKDANGEIFKHKPLQQVP